MPFCFGPLTYITCIFPEGFENEKLITETLPGDQVLTKKGPKTVALVKKGQNVKKMYAYKTKTCDLRLTDTHAVALSGQDVIANLSPRNLPICGKRQDFDVILAKDDPLAVVVDDPDDVVYHLGIEDPEKMLLILANGVWAESLGTFD